MSEIVEEQIDFFKTDHSTQYIVQVVLENGTEHVICIYPRFWKEDKYLLYEDQANHLVVHCIPQNSKVKLPKQIVQCMNMDDIKKLRRSSGTDDLEEEKENIDSHKVNSLDDIRGIISGVHHLGKLRDKKNRSSKVIEASFRTSTHGTSLLIHELFLNQIEPLSRELRRTYSERVEDFGSIRGRLTNRGMLRLVTHHRIGLSVGLMIFLFRLQFIVLSRHALASLLLRITRVHFLGSMSNSMKTERNPCAFFFPSMKLSHTTPFRRYNPSKIYSPSSNRV